jgi:hypothetical protein
MRNTIKKVIIVVPVLITSCHVSEKWKSGPVVAQTATIKIAPKNTVAVPVHTDM